MNFMKKLNKLFLVVMSALCLFAFAGCKDDTPPPETASLQTWS
jgi:uncharacterized lipoprotein YehR (DUF1307 family)